MLEPVRPEVVLRAKREKWGLGATNSGRNVRANVRELAERRKA